MAHSKACLWLSFICFRWFVIHGSGLPLRYPYMNYWWNSVFWPFFFVQCLTFNQRWSFHPSLLVKSFITSCPCCWMRVFFGRLGILPRPSIPKLHFVGSCFLHCTTRGFLGCEKNVNCELILFNFLTNKSSFFKVINTWDGRL